MQEIYVETNESKEVIDLSNLIYDLIEHQDNEVGLVFLFVKHTTCCLSTADLDPGTDKDYLNALDELIPKLRFNHPHDPSHVDDHINSTIIGPSLLLPFRNKQLELGTWQVPVLIELNGPRKRSIMVHFI